MASAHHTTARTAISDITPNTTKANARAYATNTSRIEELERWVHHYNYHRPHMALSGRAPITAVNNVPRKHN